MRTSGSCSNTWGNGKDFLSSSKVLNWLKKKKSDDGKGCHLSSLFLCDFIYLFCYIEGKGEKHQCVVASHAPPTGDLACNPGMCPDWESNQRPFGSQTGVQSTEPHQPGLSSLYATPFPILSPMESNGSQPPCYALGLPVVISKEMKKHNWNSFIRLLDVPVFVIFVIPHFNPSIISNKSIKIKKAWAQTSGYKVSPGYILYKIVTIVLLYI